MPIVNRFADLHDEITAWRQDLHAHPELLFDTHRTSASVAEKLRAFGCDDVVEGLGRTGVVGVIKGKGATSAKVIGLRADMDALPIIETTGLDYASSETGKMHACGHDGHTAMLLGAAKYLCETRRFDGTAIVIFQPAEEGGGGGREMCEDGLMDRFGIQEVYGMHNMPGRKLGSFAIRPGPVMAAADLFTIHVEGMGGHAARPNTTIDTTLVAAQIVIALQSIASRTADPLDGFVLSVTGIRTESDTFNVIPQRATMKGTVRTLNPALRDQAEAMMEQIITNTALAYGAKASLDYVRNYPVTVNAPTQTAFALEVANTLVDPSMIEPNTPPVMGAEDFSFMLEERPGAMIYIGNGDSANLHHPDYDFDDSIIPLGCSYWSRLVELAMPLKV